VSSFRYPYKQLFSGACYIDVIGTSLLGKQWQTIAFIKDDEVFIKALRQERVLELKVYQKNYKQKLVSVVCEELADDD